MRPSVRGFQTRTTSRVRADSRIPGRWIRVLPWRFRRWHRRDTKPFQRSRRLKGSYSAGRSMSRSARGDSWSMPTIAAAVCWWVFEFKRQGPCKSVVTYPEPRKFSRVTTSPARCSSTRRLDVRTSRLGAWDSPNAADHNGCRDRKTVGYVSIVGCLICCDAT